AAVAALDDWRLTGKLAVQRADQGVSATLEWHEQGERFDLRLVAPLSGGTFKLTGDAGRVALFTPEGEMFTAASAGDLVEAHLGWRLPVEGARWWVRGIPAPGSAAAQERRDAQGRWTDFAQDGWRISILDYHERAQPHLPRKLYLARDDLQVRLVIRHWQLDVGAP
ncbi:MAG: lipoprotein insertase outer membrane protein LolB, partial [Gammaproteobacteria bacterium]